MRKTYRGLPLPVLALACLLLTAGSTPAQTSLGGVTGLVKDSSGAVVPGVTVTLQNTGTNQIRTTVSTDTGLYSFPSIPAGDYLISAENAGFQKYEAKLVVRVGQELTVDISLAVGATPVVVEVKDTTPAIETGSATLSDVKESRRIETLPLNGRNIATLFTLTPGVTSQGGTQVNGLQQGNVQFLADGVTIEDKYLGDFTRVSPALEGVQEFKVEALNSTAQFSKPATISYITKSGNNQVHGSLFYTNRNNALLARNTFTGEAGFLNRNEFGGSVGGPVYIPKLYNGKDRTFFFFTYEGLRTAQSYQFLKGSPTQDLRDGDFSNYLPSDATSPYTIYDPLTTRLDPATGLYIRDPFPDNQIPANRISNMAKQALAAYPMPNVTGAPITQNLAVNLPRGDNQNKYTAKVDQVMKNDTFSFTYTFVDQVRPSPKNGSPTVDIYYNQVTARTQQATFSNTHVFGSRIVNEFRAGVTRPNSRRGPTIKDPAVTTTLGLQNATGDTGWPCLYPYDPVTYDIEFGGWPSGLFWDDDNPQDAPQTFTTFADNLSIIKGNHNLKMGALFDTKAINSNERGQPRGCYEFGPEWTGLGDENGNIIPGTGSGFASFLLGYDGVTWGPGGALRSDKGYFYHRQKNFALYFQDDWKVSPKLTLNLGLRYEFYSRYRELRDQIATYDPNSGALVLETPVDQAFAVNPAAVAAYQDAGVVFKTYQEVGYPNHLLEPDRNDWAPRIGFAYMLGSSGKTVLRGGYGISYWTLPLITLQAPTRQNPPFNFTRSQLNWPTNGADLFRMAPAYVLGGGELAFSDQEVFINAPVAISPFSPYSRDSMAQSWNLTFQQEIFRQTSLQLSYVGTHGSHLQIVDPVNTAYPASLYPDLTTQQRRANPTFNNANTLKDEGWSQSHQFQAEVRRNVTKGLVFQAFYIFQKTLNTSEQSTGSSGALPVLGDRQSGISDLSQRLQLEYGDSGYYPRQAFTFNFLIDMPWGHGQRWLSDTKGVVGKLLEGWQIAAISYSRSGLYFSPNRNFWRIADGNLPVDERTAQLWFDTSAFVQPIDPETGKTVDVITNMRPGRNILEGPGFTNVDFTIFKTTYFSETGSVRFAADFFNLFNHPNYNLPNVNNGRITSTVNEPRLIQFGLRVDF
jgi:hypothetical protein